MNCDLTGKAAVVCGGSQGIGKAVALELAALGAHVILLARNEEALQRVRSQLSGMDHEYLVADFSRPDELKERITAYVRQKAPVHILVNNTGGPPSGPLTEAPADAFERAFRQHLIANQLLAQALIPGMKSEGYGRIVNIISTSVKQPIPGLGVSNTIRGAVAGWAKTLAGELAPFGITVNNVLPGATATERLRSLFEERAQQQGRSAEEVARDWMREIPSGRFADPSEIAQAVAFLASPAAAYITGINLPVDGGRLGTL